MSRNLTIGALLILATVGFYFVSSMRRSADAPPPIPAFTVAGGPAAVYETVLPEIRDRIARDTKIVRIDSGSGAVTMRFSAYLEDHSVRLVEVGLTATSTESTTVTVVSKRFSFLPGRSRDGQDATLETSLAALIVRRTRPPDPLPPR